MQISYEKYSNEKKDARKIYNDIKPVWCVVLADYISFNKEGFQHLIRKNGRLRPRSEQMCRFNLLVYIKDILQSPDTKFIHQESPLNGSAADFWKCSEIINGQRITIVICQRKNGAKHFLSIYAKKRKSAP
jgi:hypothetical protein